MAITYPTRVLGSRHDIELVAALTWFKEIKVACDLYAQLFLWLIDIIANVSQPNIGHTTLYHTSNNLAVILGTSLSDTLLAFHLA